MFPRRSMARKTDHGLGTQDFFVNDAARRDQSLKNNNPTLGLLKTILYLCETAHKARGAQAWPGRSRIGEKEATPVNLTGLFRRPRKNNCGSRGTSGGTVAP